MKKVGPVGNSAGPFLAVLKLNGEPLTTGEYDVLS